MRAAAYARYSTANQTENSIDTQLSAINNYCQQNGHSIVSTYVDMAMSGTNMERPDFQRMLDAAKSGQFDCVVVYDISRASRDVGDWMGFRKLMLSLNVDVLSTTERLGAIDNPNDFLTELLTAGLGQHMVLQTRQKSIAGVTQRAKQGQFLGGTPPLGYDIKDGKYIVNPTEAEYIRTIFKLYAKGKSYNDILFALNGAKGKKGKPLGKNSLNSILKNERYIGTYTWNKRKVKLFRRWAGGKLNPDCVRLEGQIPSIIDTDTWEKVQKRMNDNKRKAANKAKRDYLLSGLIECEKCGSAYVGHTSTNTKGYETRYYVCGNKYRTRGCDAKNISANEIETFAVAQLQAYLLESDFEVVAKEVARQFNSASPDLSAEKKELSGITTQINNGVKALIRNPDFMELDEEITRLRGRKSELDDIIRAASNGKKTIEATSVLKLLNNSINNWDDEHKAEIIRLHVPKIYAHADGTFTVNIGVHISGCGERI